MKKLPILLLVLVSGLTAGQPGNLFTQLASVDGAEDIAQVQHQFGKLIYHLREKQSQSHSEKAFLHYAFGRVHRQFLRNYEAQVNFRELFHGGRYNCLTATSLYAAVFSELGIDFRVIETNHHIVLIAQTSEGDVLLETTDRYRGFVSGVNEIDQRLLHYQSQGPQESSEKVQFEFPNALLAEVKPGQLRNLHHYNRAVAAFNNQDWVGCATALEKASAGYRSPRLSGLGALLLTAVAEDATWSEERRLKFVRQFHAVLLSRELDVAARF
jgi:hypothetical protein